MSKVEKVKRDRKRTTRSEVIEQCFIWSVVNMRLLYPLTCLETLPGRHYCILTRVLCLFLPPTLSMPAPAIWLLCGASAAIQLIKCGEVDLQLEAVVLSIHSTSMNPMKDERWWCCWEGNWRMASSSPAYQGTLWIWCLCHPWGRSWQWSLLCYWCPWCWCSWRKIRKQMGWTTRGSLQCRAVLG